MPTKEELIKVLCERLTRAKERKETAVKQQQHYTQLRLVPSTCLPFYCPTVL